MHSHKVINIPALDPKTQTLLSKELGISKVTAQILINRGIITPAHASKFLKVDFKDILDPHSFTEMPRAVDLVKRTLKAKQRIMVFGDYDVDGVTALALVKSVLQQMSADVTHYIPHRVKEGYGFTKNIAKTAKEQDVKLLISVDCGTNSETQVKQLREQGIEVIVTDHHEPAHPRDKSCASAVINPKYNDSGYKFRELAGVGVAYKFCQALTNSVLKQDLDIVSLGTIADSVPLVGENRIFAKEGLPAIINTERIGLAALVEASGIKNKPLSVDYVGFILGPRINASGRMDSAETALQLLLSQDKQEAALLSKVLEQHNRQRQKIETAILEEAQDLISQQINFKDHRVVVLAKESWHLGVLGIVASKLADRLYRPVILISMDESSCRGSGRSVKNFHLFEGLLSCQDLLTNFGGHKHAIGMVIPRDNINGFRDRINLFAHQSMRIEDLLPSVDVDMELHLNQINEDFIRELDLLEPFGVGNPAPVFYSRGLKLKAPPRLLSRDTLKFWVTDGISTCQAIGFGLGGLNASLMRSDNFDLVYTPRIDSWQGVESIILEVKEIFLK